MLRQNWITLLLSSGSLLLAALINGATGQWRVAAWILIAGFGVMAVVLGLFGFWQRSTEKRWRTGVPGVAIISSIEQSGGVITFNQQPLVTLGLEVHPEGLPPYALRKRFVVPLAALGQLGIGNALAVYVDPKKPKRLTVDWGTPVALE